MIFPSQREKELAHLVAKLEDEQQVILRSVKQVKELANRVEHLEEELHTERQHRAKAEQQRGSLNQEVEDLSQRLKDCSGDAASQAEAARRREQETARVRRDLEEEHKIYQDQMEAVKRNYQQNLSDLSEKLRSSEVLIQRSEFSHAINKHILYMTIYFDRLDREKNSLQDDNDALRDVIDRKNKDIYNIDKKLKTTDNQLKVEIILYTVCINMQVKGAAT